jgi:hypothetical protein
MRGACLVDSYCYLDLRAGKPIVDMDRFSVAVVPLLLLKFFVQIHDQHAIGLNAKMPFDHQNLQKGAGPVDSRMTSFAGLWIC